MSQELYDELNRAGWVSLDQPRTRAALALAGTVPGRRVLDVGCADGEVSLALARAGGGLVMGIDISQVAVDACARRGIEAHLVNLDQQAIPVTDARFDLVYLAEVIEHLSRPDRAIEEIRRVLEPGGHLVLTTPNLACLPNRFLLMAGLQPIYTEVSEHVVLGRGLRVLGQRGQPVGHLRIYTRRALMEFLDLHGFDVVRLRGAAFHTGGAFGAVETALSHLPGLAMQLVVLARKR